MALQKSRTDKAMQCTKCGKVSDDQRVFATYRDKEGVFRRRGICKECRGKYAIDNFERLKKWRENYNFNNRTTKRMKDAERRQNVKTVIDAIKAETPCVDCGRKFPPVAMDFDHVRGKNKSVSHLVSGAYKIELILEEIKLCDIVCACCHRVRTADRKQNHAPKKGK